MKNNPVPLRVDEMHIDGITLVYADYAGRQHVPVNPAAEIVACKGGPVDPITSALVGAFERLGLARKSKPAETEGQASEVAKKDGVEESVAQAMEDTARSNLYGVLYDMEWAIGQIMNAPGFDDASRRAAVDAVLDKYGAQIAALVAMIYAEEATEVATKAGKRHSAEDLKSIQTAHENIGKIAEAAKAAHDATSKLLDKPADEPEGEKSAIVPPAAAPAAAAAIAIDANAEKSALEQISASFAELQRTVQAALDPTALKATIDVAVKSAVEADRAELTAANERAVAAETRATEAEAAKSAAEQTASKAQADAVDAARARSAPAGHEDPKQAHQSQADAAKSGADAAPAKPKTLHEAIAVLHKVAPAT